jgi:hypothetical protein
LLLLLLLLLLPLMQLQAGFQMGLCGRFFKTDSSGSCNYDVMAAMAPGDVWGVRVQDA